MVFNDKVLCVNEDWIIRVMDSIEGPKFSSPLRLSSFIKNVLFFLMVFFQLYRMICMTIYTIDNINAAIRLSKLTPKKKTILSNETFLMPSWICTSVFSRLYFSITLGSIN